MNQKRCRRCAEAEIEDELTVTWLQGFFREALEICEGHEKLRQRMIELFAKWEML